MEEGKLQTSVFETQIAEQKVRITRLLWKERGIGFSWVLTATHKRIALPHRSWHSGHLSLFVLANVPCLPAFNIKSQHRGSQTTPQGSSTNDAILPGEQSRQNDAPWEFPLR